jgi:hypothetical protein
MATQTSLAEYKLQLEADPSAKNDGTWYARTTIKHDELVYKEGAKLPALTNAQVLQLLDINALTSTAPAGAQQQGATEPDLPAGAVGRNADGVPVDENGVAVEAQ